MKIGEKLKQARKKSGYTQEQLAEQLGVSRQTISNWENDKFYPDIVSVIKLSDLCNISLDELLKGETPMNDYVKYLDESTNVVKSKRRLSQIVLTSVYLAIWAFAVLVFWCFTGEQDGIGYGLLYLWILLPLTTLVVSYLFGKSNAWGKLKWLYALGMGIMYMLAEYATFSLSNMVAFHHINLPDAMMIPVGAVISLLGIGAGHVVYLWNRRKESRT